ncbi:MAG: type II methionyl aminopeptidase [archaeon]
MTEKNYGGQSSYGAKGAVSTATKPLVTKKTVKQIKDDKPQALDNDLGTEEQNYIKAGKIAAKVKEYVKTIVKSGVPLLEIAEKIESKIQELGGKPAFPVNLSIDTIAAHATPLFNDQETAHGLLKVDLGVHIDGCIADTSLSFDLDGLEENKKLIEAAEAALKKALEVVRLGIPLREIGQAIEKTINEHGFVPVHNLSGHSLSPNVIHAGITIPNYDNSQTMPLEEGAYAIEPFTTNGAGAVRDGKPSTIYSLESEGAVRDNFAREVLMYIVEEYQTLPFCTRWLVKKFGTRALIAVKRIEEAGILHSYHQLIERGGGKVAQAEHTILITKDKKIITTQ